MILFRTGKASSQSGKHHFFRIVIFPDWPMSMTNLIYECAGCRFRFPAAAVVSHCPRCKEPLPENAGIPTPQHLIPAELGRGNSLPIVALLDNIRSIYNVGSIFRTAEGAGITHLYLCGITPTPDHPKLAKTALGAEQMVGWSAHPNGLAVIQELKAAGCQVWAIEGGARATSLLEMRPVDEGPLVLVVGNENAGIDPAILDHSHHVLALPMLGVKQSLNVSVAFGIAAYHLRTCAILSHRNPVEHQPKPP